MRLGVSRPIQYLWTFWTGQNSPSANETMNCIFKTIDESIPLHKCERCGYEIKIRQDPSKIHRACPAMTPVEKVESFVSTMVDFVKSGGQISSEGTAEERLNVCKECPHFDGNSCRLCGCVVAWKAKIEAAHCPIDKW